MTELVSLYLISMEMGGVQRVALNLSSGLVEKGYEVDVVLVNAKGELLKELPDEVTVVDLDANRVATTVLSVRRYLQQRDPDVFYAMMSEINVISSIAHRLSQTDSRLVISEHNMLTNSISSVKDTGIVKLASFVYPLADHAVAVSQGVYTDLIESTRLSPAKISQIYNPVDIDQIRSEASESIDHPWLDSEEYNVIITAGRHVPQKKFDTLIQSFERLNDDDARLIILGKGNETEALRQVADDLGVSDRVEFPGLVENPFQYISRADVFALSSEYEGFGMILVEALACGCPVVSTNCPSGPEEILEGGMYGPLVSVGSVEELSDGIESVLESPISSDRLQKRAEDFSVGTITSEYEEVLFG